MMDHTATLTLIGDIEVKFAKSTAYGLHALMYMVRHITQLPLSIGGIARAECIPQGQLAKLFPQLVKAGLVKPVKGRPKKYAFAKDPEHISLLDLFEAVEGEPLFDDCLLRHCVCTGTTENCLIYAQWHEAGQKMRKVFSQTSLVNAAWSHPEHRFANPSVSPKLGGLAESNATHTEKTSTQMDNIQLKKTADGD
jgi:Rrf2 family iron-sulfur cluster assembly transcriptional regulator